MSLASGGVYDHVSIACDVATSLLTLPLTAANSYFVVSCAAAGASVGRDSTGIERPSSVTGCR